MLVPIINIADISLEQRPPVFAPSAEVAERFDAKMGYIGPALVLENLGTTLLLFRPASVHFRPTTTT